MCLPHSVFRFDLPAGSPLRNRAEGELNENEMERGVHVKLCALQGSDALCLLPAETGSIQKKEKIEPDEVVR